MNITDNLKLLFLLVINLVYNSSINDKIKKLISISGKLIYLNYRDLILFKNSNRINLIK